MDVKRLTFDLAVYEVSMTDNWCAPDYAKEHFEKGAFIIHDGVNYHFCTWNGGSEYVYANVMPNDVILGDMPKNVGGEGVNILDVAKSFAVIQKPELIKELK